MALLRATAAMILMLIILIIGFYVIMNDMCLCCPLTAKLPINFIILAKYPPFFWVNRYLCLILPNAYGLYDTHYHLYITYIKHIDTNEERFR